MSTYDDLTAAAAALEAERAEARFDATHWEQEYDALLAKHEAHMATHQPETPAKTWLLGMATEKDRWDERAAAIGHPVNVRRRFEPTWDPAALTRMAQECHASGCLPYISTKLGDTRDTPSIRAWTDAANGKRDADAEKIGRELASLGYPIRLTFHHEPRDATLAELKVWGQALTRLFRLIRHGAGGLAHNLILGPTDNGHPWGEKWGKLTDDQLATYYTDDLLAACDVMGADFYDGATNTNPGEPAWIKMRNFAAYFDRRGFQGVNNPGWKYDAGEYQIVDPEDCDDLWTFLQTDAGKDFNALAIFNSTNNNRATIPDRIGGTWVLTGDRLAAFRRMLEAADVKAV